jgi:hypothetical protein
MGAAGSVVLCVCAFTIPLAAQSAPAQRAGIPPVFPAGTVVPVRFLERMAGGRDSIGQPVLVQTLAALVSGGCVAVPPFTEVAGVIHLSRRGGWFGRAGELGLTFTSLRAGSDWVPLSAVLDSLEYARPGTISDSGDLSGQHRSFRHDGARLVPVALAGATGVAIIPAAMYSGWSLARRGARAAIVAGEAGAIRLTRPLAINLPGGCQRPTDNPALVQAPALPRFLPHTDDRQAHHPGDPINLILLGTPAEIDSAFARAGWLVPTPHSTRHVAKEFAAALFNRAELKAPVSTQYFEGRAQDLSFELPGPTVRVRHHVRFWLLDSTLAVWVGAANQDIGLKVEPGSLSATHRISPDVDRERDLIVRELESTGCADLMMFDSLPGSIASGRTAAGQSFNTDRRAAIIQLRDCPRT